ncbi:NUDIX domain-containing protein [Haloechinothrix sp. YIM 98757]|uniref:NUDIX domain-containing protein n=1 Tax=Haloechinothrix aidingensis TaxID=2752311 RepID=A0A838ADZ5_9PSEU|nr:NUDIX domain-containing protein [Haloechinothrix aidingensis]MBA0127407.1 NUDIX domain-containing protein [Haloechinothrix aidingensis]
MTGERGQEHGGVPIRPAATVILLRDGDAGVEVFLQHRVASMDFAGGMTVFPGGGVDQRDSESSVAWQGPEPAEWGAELDCDASLARALACAAVRETFEESGVLLAGHTDGTVVTDTGPYAWARQALVTRELSLAAFLAETGLILRADLLRPWSHWLTPEGETRRYDTRFFLAALPEGQLADGATSEAAGSGWQRPADALDDARQGRTMMMPPTWSNLSDLAEVPSVADALAAQRRVERTTPRLVRDDEGVRLVIDGREWS